MLNTVDIQDGQLYFSKSNFLWFCELSKQNYVTHDDKEHIKGTQPGWPTCVKWHFIWAYSVCKSTRLGVTLMQRVQDMLNTVDIQDGQLYFLKSNFLWCCELSKQNYYN